MRITVSEPGTCCLVTALMRWLPKPWVIVTLTPLVPGPAPSPHPPQTRLATTARSAVRAREDMLRRPP